MAATLSISGMPISWILYISLWLCSLVPVSRPENNSTCPPNASIQAFKCTAKLSALGVVFNDTIPLDKALKDGCVQGHFFDAINCMERITHKCRHDKSDEAHKLRNMMNVDSTRKAIVYFCSNVEEYLSNLDCIRASRPAMKTCGDNAKALLTTQMEATSNVDSRMRFQCGFYSTAVGCAKSTLKERCNDEISSIVFTVMAGLEPPVCTKTIYSIAATGGKQHHQRDQAGADGGGGGAAGSILVGRGHLLFLHCLCSCVILLLCKFNVRW